MKLPVRTLTVPTASRVLPAVDEVEIDQAEQGLAQRRAVIEAGGAGGAARAHPGRRHVRLEEALLAERHRHPGRPHIVEPARIVPVRRRQPHRTIGDHLPELAQPLEAALRRVAGDQRRIDAADRDAVHPVGLEPRLVQRLIDARLIGAERAAALEDQRDGVASGRPPGGRRRARRRQGSGIHAMAS